jgi:hypothetical protein
VPKEVEGTNVKTRKQLAEEGVTLEEQNKALAERNSDLKSVASNGFTKNYGDADRGIYNQTKRV